MQNDFNATAPFCGLSKNFPTLSQKNFTDKLTDVKYCDILYGSFTKA